MRKTKKRRIEEIAKDLGLSQVIVESVIDAYVWSLYNSIIHDKESVFVRNLFSIEVKPNGGGVYGRVSSTLRDDFHAIQNA